MDKERLKGKSDCETEHSQKDGLHYVHDCQVVR